MQIVHLGEDSGFASGRVRASEKICGIRMDTHGYASTKSGTQPTSLCNLDSLPTACSLTLKLSHLATYRQIWLLAWITSALEPCCRLQWDSADGFNSFRMA